MIAFFIVELLFNSLYIPVWILPNLCKRNYFKLRKHAMIYDIPGKVNHSGFDTSEVYHVPEYSLPSST